jgi:hypothetical protein
VNLFVIRRLREDAKGLGTRLRNQERTQPFCGMCQILPESGRSSLERLYVSSLPALRTLDYVELHGLTFLQALETT